MVKKSNKTEQVLRLITKNEEEPSDRIEIQVKPSPEKELKYEAKLKIELEPEIHLKSKDGKGLKEESALLEQNDRLVNIAEILAKEKIALVMEKMKVCNCPVCVNDVLALTLNSLPTKYVTTDAGKQYFQLDMYKKQYETDVLAALTKACVRVKASPRH